MIIDYIEPRKLFVELKKILGDGWLMDKYEYDDRRHDTVLFGQTLLEHFTDRVVYVVEKPRSAVICAHKVPPLHGRNAVWVATDSQTPTDNQLELLWDRDVVFFPSARQYGAWCDALPWPDSHPGTWLVDDSMVHINWFCRNTAEWDIATLALMGNAISRAYYNGWNGDLMPTLRLLGAFKFR